MDLANLGIRIDAKSVDQASDKLDRFQKEGKETERANDKIGASAKRMGSAMKAAAGIAAGALAGISVGALFTGAIRETEQYNRNLLRTQSILDATRGVSGKTTASLEAQAKVLARATLASTEGIMEAQQQLLTFRNIRGDVFDGAIEGALSMSVAMKQDLKSSVLQLAKALEDPVKGMSALSRSGTVFTDAQKDMVKGMVEAGETAKAQKFILSELAAQYGDVAKAEALGLAGARDSRAQSLQEMLISIGQALRLTQAATAANNAFARTYEFIGGHVNQLIGIIGTAAAVVVGIYTPAIYAAVVATGAWVASLITLRGALLASGIGALVVGAGLLVGAFLDLVQSAGGFGSALGLLKSVGIEVFDRIRRGGALVGETLVFAALKMKGAFMEAFASIASSFASLTQTIADGLNSLFGTELSGIGAEFAAKLAEDGKDYSDAGSEGLNSLAKSWGDLLKPIEAVKKLQDQVANFEAPNNPGTKPGAPGAIAAAGGGGGGGESELSRLLKEGATLTEQMRTPLEVYADEVDRLGTLLNAGAINQETFNRAIGKAEDTLNAASGATVRLGQDAASTFSKIVKDASSAKDAVGQLLDRLADQLLQSAFTGLFGGPLDDLGAALTGAVTPSAKGNVFNDGRLIPFANGGVVSRPTTFPMRGGNTGLMGEAGPEAIMPLSRTASGKLGVSAGSQRQEVDVRVSMDQNGNLQAYVNQVSARNAAALDAHGAKQQRRGAASQNAKLNARGTQ